MRRSKETRRRCREERRFFSGMAKLAGCSGRRRSRIRRRYGRIFSKTEDWKYYIGLRKKKEEREGEVETEELQESEDMKEEESLENEDKDKEERNQEEERNYIEMREEKEESKTRLKKKKFREMKI